MALIERKFVVGQFVYTKIRGYPPWPSCVIDIPNDGKKKAVVRYFGWSNEV